MLICIRYLFISWDGRLLLQIHMDFYSFYSTSWIRVRSQYWDLDSGEKMINENQKEGLVTGNNCFLLILNLNCHKASVFYTMYFFLNLHFKKYVC